MFYLGAELYFDVIFKIYLCFVYSLGQKLHRKV